MSSWIEPRIQWTRGTDSAVFHRDLLERATLLTRWPTGPLDVVSTDCFLLEPHYWIWQPLVGGIRFTSNAPELMAFPATGVDPAAFEQIVQRSWLPAVYQVWGRQVIHASASARASDGGTVVFTGPSGAGKSTLAFSLAQRDGWVQVADDTLAFSSSGAATLLHPMKNEARLRPATAAYHGKTGAPDPVSWPTISLKPVRVYVLHPDEHASQAAHIAPLEPAESYPRLLEQAHAMTLEIPSHNQRLMRDYLALASVVPIFRLTYRRSFDSMDAILDAIEQHAGLDCTAAS